MKKKTFNAPFFIKTCLDCITHSEESTIYPFPYTDAHKFPYVASASVIDRGKWVMSFLSFKRFLLLNPSYGWMWKLETFKNRWNAQVLNNAISNTSQWLCMIVILIMAFLSSRYSTKIFKTWFVNESRNMSKALWKSRLFI